MPQIDLEPIGKWERVTQPLHRKFTLHAEMGLDTHLDPDAAKATAEAFGTMARYIDLMEAREEARRQITNLLGGGVLLIGVFVAMAWLV